MVPAKSVERGLGQDATGGRGSANNPIEFSCNFIHDSATFLCMRAPGALMPTLYTSASGLGFIKSGISASTG